MEVLVREHEHPLHLRDLQLEYEEYEDELKDENEDIIVPQDFHCNCRRCGEEINWLHRYFYECGRHSCDFALHKFCAKLPETIDHKFHSAHSLTRFPNTKKSWSCYVCHTNYPPEISGYGCLKCNFFIDIRCAMATTEYQIIHHPSHPHPLVPLSEPFSHKCDACGEKHEGIFFLCTTCFGVFIHTDCASLPKKLFIQEITKNNFFHNHPLTLSYSFPETEQKANFWPRCRVCDKDDYNENLWILKCEKCRYYTHLSCVIFRRDSSSSIGNKIIPNLDSDVDILHLPFPTVSDSILKHLFSDQVGCENFNVEDSNLLHNCHPHPLNLVRTDITTVPACHDPMKNIELLCNGCIRPITSMPFYKCANEVNECNFFLHEWCTRLPDQLQNYTDHKQHTLILQPNAFNDEFSCVFVCAVCKLSCNGFVYTCVQCDYHVDVKCAFIPEKITHEAHPGHLMLWVETKYTQRNCRICRVNIVDPFAFFCNICDVYLHGSCAMLLPREVRHMYDEHPMSISYNPIENHRSDYICEICEEEFNPSICFYHCYQCAQSIHSFCAPHILLHSERAVIHRMDSVQGVYKFVNIKFGGIYNIKDHPHPLIFDQGVKSDGNCIKCDRILQYKMILKCQQCSYAIHIDCCKHLGC